MPFVHNIMATQYIVNQIHIVGGHSGVVNRVAFGPCSLASCSTDKTVRLWQLDRFTQMTPSPLCGHTLTVHGCIFSQYGTLASCSADGKCILWDSNTGNRHTSLVHPQRLAIRVCTFSPDDVFLATGGDDNNLCIWEITSRRLIRTYAGHDAAVVCCAFSPNSAFLVSGSTAGDIRIWDATVMGHTRQLYLDANAHNNGVTCCEFAPTYGAAAQSGPFILATCGMDEIVKLWTFSGSHAGVTLTLRSNLMGNTGPVLDLCFSPHRQLLAAAGEDKSVRLWDLTHATCRPTKEIEVQSSVTSCAFSIHGDLLAIAYDTSIEIWKITLNNEGTPEEYLCPITREVMYDPAIACDGYTYERAAFMAWVNAGNKRSYKTDELLTVTSLSPNHEVKRQIVHASKES